MERRLGRGLGSLLGGPRAPESVESAAPGPTGDRADEPAPLETEVEVDRIDPNPQQPRTVFDPAGLQELTQSVAQHGILQPLVLRRVGDRYQVVAGERRLRAARQAGLERVPAVFRDALDDSSMLELALVENVQRRDLDAIEKARGYRKLMEALGLTQEEVAAKVGLKRSTVANHLRLLELPIKAQEAIAQGLISMGHARALLGLADPERLLGLVERTAREGLSVRRVEELVREAGPRASKSTSPAAAPSEPELPPWARELETRMREHLGTRVRLRLSGAEKGQVVIDYFNRASLDRICEVLAPRRQV